MNKENNYDWDRAFQKLSITWKEKPTIQTHWQTKDGKPIKYADMSNKHLINILKKVCLRTIEDENVDIIQMYKIISLKIIKELQNREVLEFF